MTPDLQEHLFEHFTHQRTGQRAGARLACIFGAVRPPWGWIEMHSAPDAGTEFRVFCRAIQRTVAVVTRFSATTLNAAQSLSWDADGRSGGRRALRSEPHPPVTVIASLKPTAAPLRSCCGKRQRGNIDVVVTDSPRRHSGFDLAINCARPGGLKVVMLWQTNAELKNHQATLQKNPTHQTLRSDELRKASRSQSSLPSQNHAKCPGQL